MTGARAGIGIAEMDVRLPLGAATISPHPPSSPRQLARRPPSNHPSHAYACECARAPQLEDAMRITELKEEKETANRALRDAMYTSRYAEPGKAKLMSQSLHEAAEATGVAALLTAPGPSPYRIA